MKRLLSCTSSEMLKMDGQELKQAILASEGRTVMTETVVAIEPLLGDLTNAELAVSFGSDMVLLNCFDCNHPEIKGTGLGLSIVKRLCDLLKLEITVESKLNQGTKFVLNFPLSKLK